MATRTQITPTQVTTQGPVAPCCFPIGSVALSEAEAEDLANVFKAVADPARLRILSIIAASPTGEICACDFPAALGRSQPTVSHHLRQLVEAGLISREQRGKWAWFRIDTEMLDRIGQTFRIA